MIESGMHPSIALGVQSIFSIFLAYFIHLFIEAPTHEFGKHRSRLMLELAAMNA